MSNLCQKPYLQEGKLLRCGGVIKDVLEQENGHHVLYEVCVRCSHKKALYQVLSESPERVNLIPISHSDT